MAKMNVWKRIFPEARTHEGAVAQRVSAKTELRRTVLTCLLWEDTFYEKGSNIAERIAKLVRENKTNDVAELAREARLKMQLRHVPLFLTRELARRKGSGPLVAATLEEILQRADEPGEFLAMYWKDKKQPLSAGVKRGLAQAFVKFDAYQLAKYDRHAAVKLRDVLFLCHAKPKDEAQAEVWKKLVAGELESSDTWEVSLSAGKDKKATFERLLVEGKLGGMAVLRNLRLMLAAGVAPKLIRERLSQGVARALPFRFVTAARQAPKLEDAIEEAMLKGIAGLAKLKGSTGLVVDVSGSMNYKLAKKGETTRMDAAAGLAILLREKAEVRDCDFFGLLRGAAGAARVRVARCDREVAGAQRDVPEAGTRGAPREDRLEESRATDRGNRRAVARRDSAGMDEEGVRGKRGAVQARDQLWKWLDSRGWLVGADSGLHRGGGGRGRGVGTKTRRS